MALKESDRCIVRQGNVRCPRPVALKEHGLCTAHYKRLIRHGEVGSPLIGKWKRLPKFELPPRARRRHPDKCRVPGCPYPVLYKGTRLCRGHYSRARYQELRGLPISLRPIRPRKKRRQVA